MRIHRQALSRDLAQKKMDASAKGTFHYFKYEIEREWQLLRRFRRGLFCVELGPKASQELAEIRRIQEASTNAGIGDAERMLFDKLMKARISSLVPQATGRRFGHRRPR